MKKLKDLIKESWLTGPTGKYSGKNIEFGKIYTAKDMPPFQTPKQVNEVDRRTPKDEYFMDQATKASKSITNMLRVFRGTSFAKTQMTAKYLKMLKMVDKEFVNNTKKLFGYNESVEVNEEDLEKGGSSLPSKLKMYMSKFSDEVNKAKLNKKKKVAILFKVIKSLGLNYKALRKYNYEEGRVSGTVYSGTEPDFNNLMSDTVREFMYSNPLHPDIFPDIRIMESEIISMVKKL